ncbi:uncharacterized protein LOC110690851 [Chenopodium quinoa]|uniref:uncharacterized protein LOC110690851 n=1 Tax=Chenopodium quinoa TaxID=63459 RepID=UPI000B775666|nr:uncharacterized protein LOC110690851 [Chenopodium quinoa]
MVKKKSTKKSADSEEDTGGSICGYRYKLPSKGKAKPKEPAKGKEIPKKTKTVPEKAIIVSKNAKPESDKAKIIPKKAKIVPKKAKTVHNSNFVMLSDSDSETFV